MKAAYIWAMALFDIFLLSAAIAAPVIATPDKYYWTAGLLFLFINNSLSFTKRINRWEQDES